MTIGRKLTYSLHYTYRTYTIQVYLASISLYSVFELTRNAFNWSVFRSTNSLLCWLRYDSSPCLWKCSKNIYGERERATQKKRTEEKMRKSQSNIKKKKETQLREKNEQWNATEQRERENMPFTWFPYK